MSLRLRSYRHSFTASLLIAPTLVWLAQAARISLSPAPLVRIREEGRPEYEFTSIAAAFQLSSGELLVADSRGREVRVYSPDGRFLRNLGREGAGPGEFRNIRLLRPVGDTVFVWDGVLRRLTRYAASGTLINTTAITTAEGSLPIYPVGRLRDGRWLVMTLFVPSTLRPAGMFRDSTHVGTIPAAAVGAVKWIGWYQGTTFYAYKQDPNAERAQLAPVMFNASTRTIAVDNAVFVADGGNGEIIRLGGEGTTLTRFRVPFQGQPITDAMLGKAKREALVAARNAQARARVEAQYSRAALPSHTPAFDAVIVGPEGELWVQEFTADSTRARRYSVVRSNGAGAEFVTTPPGARLLDVGSNYAWIVIADVDGLERLEKYAVRRR